MALTIPNTLSNGITVDGLNLEANFDAIAGWAAASVVEVGGATMTGPLVLSGAPTIAAHAATKAYIDALVLSTVPIGVLQMWPAAAAPAGWSLANGTAVSRSTYAALFALIGTTYGVGDGATTFNLPNFKGRVPVGLDAAQTEFDALAETGGQKTVALHDHSINHDHPSTALTIADNTVDRVTRLAANVADQHLAMRDTDGNGVPDATGGIGNNMSVAYETEHGHTGTVDLPNFTGTSGTAGVGANNMNPYLVINYIIKLL